MLELTHEKKLASILSTTREELRRLANNSEQYYEEFELFDPLRPSKVREVVSSKGVLRTIQNRLYRRIFLEKLPLLPHNHGGVKGRSIRSNFAIHASSRFIYKVDISNFYPSIDHHQVRHFLSSLGCVPSVAKICTKLCTYKNRLAQGLVTSSILANHILGPVDLRIAQLCELNQLRYSRFVDDLTISGNFDLVDSGFPKLLVEIIESTGFRVSAQKTEGGELGLGMAITGIRKNRRGNWDVERDYIDEIEKQLVDAKQLAEGLTHPSDRPYYLEAQILGRIRFIEQLNKSRGKGLLQRFNKIDWPAVELNALQQKLVVCRKVLRKKGDGS